MKKVDKENSVYFEEEKNGEVFGEYYKESWRNFSFTINQFGLISLRRINKDLLYINEDYFYIVSGYLLLKSNFELMISIKDSEVIYHSKKWIEYKWFITESLRYYFYLFSEKVNVNVFKCKNSPALGMSLDNIIVLNESLEQNNKSSFYLYWIHELLHQKIGVEWTGIENEEAVVEYIQLVILARIFSNSKKTILSFFSDKKANEDQILDRMKRYYSLYGDDLTKIKKKIIQRKKFIGEEI